MSQKKTTTRTELVEVRYADIGQSRPSFSSSGVFHVRRIVADIQPIESQRGQAESGEIRFDGKQVRVYRLCGSGSWWSSDKAAILEPVRAVYSFVKNPAGTFDSLGENRNA